MDRAQGADRVQNREGKVTEKRGRAVLRNCNVRLEKREFIPDFLSTMLNCFSHEQQICIKFATLFSQSIRKTYGSRDIAKQIKCFFTEGLVNGFSK